MNSQEISTLLTLTETLLSGYTRLLDENGDSIDGKLRIKLGLAELNLYKIIELLKKEK